MRFSQSTHLLILLSLETLASIIRTALPILVELIDLVNSATVFLSQLTLLRWLTFLLASQADSHSPALLDLIISPDASVCFTMAFPPFGNFDHNVASVSIDFPKNSQQDMQFHHTAYDYSCPD